jgi:predicted GTPase
MDALMIHFSQPQEEIALPRFAVGRPNAGKSSFINAGKERYVTDMVILILGLKVQPFWFRI